MYIMMLGMATHSITDQWLNSRRHTPTEASLDPRAVTKLLSGLVAVAHDPKRFSDAELDHNFEAFRHLLNTHPSIHLADPAFFGFHQALIEEHEARIGADLQDDLDAELDDHGDWATDAELAEALGQPTVDDLAGGYTQANAA